MVRKAISDVAKEVAALGIGSEQREVLIGGKREVAIHFAAVKAQVTPPQLAFPLTDVPNATQIEVQYAPEPWLLNQNYYLALHAFSCGSGSCPAPWDLGIGPIYFRALYLNSANQVLAQSDVQQLPGR